MAKRGDPRVSRLVVIFLRTHAGVTQAEFGRASRVTQANISLYELGKGVPPEESLRRMAKVARVEWTLVVHLRRYFAAILSAIDRQGAVPGSEPLALAVLEPALLAVAPYLVEATEPNRQPLKEARREAEVIWTSLERFPIPRRRRLIELTLQASQSPALAVRVCEASVQAAAHDAREALELAELALSIAQRVPDNEGRARVEGYSWACVANARRVANDFDGAEEAFAHAWDRWRAGVEVDSKLAPEWRLLSLEASLRREQHRFPEALELLDRARAAVEDNPKAAARLLLKKEHVFEAMGDTEGALAALAEAAPFVEASGDPDLLWRLLFNRTADLCSLERFEAAAELLPRVRKLAERQANALDLIRVVWLDARIAAGQGRDEEAITGLEQVRRDFAARELPYDAALASLDLAVLWLKSGRTAEVRELATEMEAIFKSRKIHREALAALVLFCDAARRETATVALARRISEYLVKARHDPKLRFEAEAGRRR